MMYQLKTIVSAEAVKYFAAAFVTQELVALIYNVQAVNPAQTTAVQIVINWVSGNTMRMELQHLIHQQILTTVPI